MVKKDFNSLLEQSITNIEKDRKTTITLLDDLVNYIGTSTEKHKEVAFSLAKYVEVLQRSNEQLVKLVSLLNKGEQEDLAISSNEINNVFENLLKDKKTSIKKK